MFRRLLIAASVTSLFAGTAFAEPASPVAAPGSVAAVDGVTIGNRLASVGAIRPVGEDFELTVRGLGDQNGPDGFIAWRDLADVVAEAAAFMHQRRIVIVAHAPAIRDATKALHVGQLRAQALREALQSRGVAPERILTSVRPALGRGVGAVDFVITFEHRKLQVSGVAVDPSQGRLADLDR